MEKTKKSKGCGSPVDEQEPRSNDIVSKMREFLIQMDGWVRATAGGKAREPKKTESDPRDGVDQA
ncbi:MAG TPA: hypothetical protein VL588_04525 [Bdellovibrionota bacterium]|nr:hypothetical protein [Bdellovibrionota bacterium]